MHALHLWSVHEFISLSASLYFCVCVKVHSLARVLLTVFQSVKHIHMLARMNTHASLACKHVLYACTCTHACKNKHSLCVCVSPCLYPSVICLWIFARTCIQTHTNTRNGCTHCKNSRKSTRVHAPFLSRSLFFFRLVSVFFYTLFSRLNAHIITHTCNLSVCLCVGVYLCVWLCVCVCVLF